MNFSYFNLYLIYILCNIFQNKKFTCLKNCVFGLFVVNLLRCYLHIFCRTFSCWNPVCIFFESFLCLLLSCAMWLQRIRNNGQLVKSQIQFSLHCCSRYVLGTVLNDSIFQCRENNNNTFYSCFSNNYSKLYKIIQNYTNAAKVLNCTQ